MLTDDPGGRGDAFSVLRRFARKPSAAEHCELCSRAVGAEHPHVLELAQRRLLCVCDACAILFPGGHAKYKRVPSAIRGLPGFQLTDAQWDGLLIPIGMAFFYRSSPADRIVAVYPSPAGGTESQLPLDRWDEIVANNPVLEDMAPDVEALIVNRLGGQPGMSPAPAQPPQYHILPIDQCFRLVGLVRLHWKGLSGGTEVWDAVAGFFADIRSKADVRPEVARA